MRECGSCTLCCTVLYVPELSKKEGIKCENCTTKCEIHKSRPESCKIFKCEWLKGNLDEEMKPNKIHIMIEKLPDVPVVLAMVEHKFFHVLEDLEEKLKEYNKKGIAVVASNGQALIPKGMTEQNIMDYVFSAARKMGFK